jgi:hypothetical protein
MKRYAQTDADLSTFRRYGTISRALIVFLAGALLAVFMAASQHHHETDADDRDCAICTAVVHHVVNLTLPPTVAPTVASVAYLTTPVPFHTFDSAFKSVCPPICGPPFPS